MTEIKKVIHGYHVELHLNSEGELEWTDCYISKDGYTGTLAFLEGLGYLINSDDYEHEVSPKTIEAISTWAYARGY